MYGVVLLLLRPVRGEALVAARLVFVQALVKVTYCNTRGRVLAALRRGTSYQVFIRAHLFAEIGDLGNVSV